MVELSRVTLDNRESIQKVVNAMRHAGYGDRDIPRQLTSTCVVDLDLLREVLLTYKPH